MISTSPQQCVVRKTTEAEATVPKDSFCKIQKTLNLIVIKSIPWCFQKREPERIKKPGKPLLSFKIKGKNLPLTHFVQTGLGQLEMQR